MPDITRVTLFGQMPTGGTAYVKPEPDTAADPVSTEPRRFTVTITPMTRDELQQVIDSIRKQFGRKHLVHVIGDQPSGTSLGDAPRGEES